MVESGWRVMRGATPGGLAVLGLIAATIAALGLFGDAARAALAYDRAAVEGGAWYRFLSANLVHLGPAHLRMNLLGIALVAFVLIEALAARGIAMATLCSALGVTLGLHVFAPDVMSYVGFSGVLHGLFVWGGVALIRAGRRIYGTLILVVIVLKLVWEQRIGPAPGAEAAVAGRILVDSHLFGAAGGAVAALRWPRRGMLAGLMVLCVASPALAHRADVTLATIEPAPGGATLTLHTHVAAFALRQPFGDLSDETRAQLAAMSDEDLRDYIAGASAYLLASVRLRDGEEDIAPEAIRYPAMDLVRQEGLSPNAFTAAPPVTLRFTLDGAVSDRALRLQLPAMLGDYRLTVQPASGTPTLLGAHEGQPSPSFDLGVARPWSERALIYLREGIDHVVPSGWDHMLFIAALVLALPTLRHTVLQATVFTLAHSVTLTLAALKLIPAATIWVEIGIAASIVMMALGTVVALRREEQPAARTAPWRFLLIFGFGLVHGMGFAGFFSDLSLDPVDLVLSLASFNIGVEIGQIAVLIAVLGGVVLARRFGADRAVRLWGSVAIALAGLYWTIERLGTLS